MDTNYINFKHENHVSKFLASVSVSPKFLEYDNFAIYAEVKHYLKTTIVNERDSKIFNKFCRHWVVTKGVCETKWLTKIKGMLKYYNKKAEDFKLRNLRLKRKQQSKLTVCKQRPNCKE